MPDNALRRLGRLRKPGAWFVDHLDSHLESNGPGRVDPGWFHPSDFGHPCDAFLAFRFLGAPSTQNIQARTQRIFDLGNARDIALKRLTKKAGITLITKEEDRKIIIPELRIRGELDDWVQNPLNGEKFIVDYKTMNKDEFDALEAAKPAHVIQVHPYEFAKETYQGFVLYENKNDQNWKLMPADFNITLWQERVVNRVEKILEGLRKGYVNRTPIPNDSSCAFHSICSIANIPKLLEESEIKL